MGWQHGCYHGLDRDALANGWVGSMDVIIVVGMDELANGCVGSIALSWFAHGCTGQLMGDADLSDKESVANQGHRRKTLLYRSILQYPSVYYGILHNNILCSAMLYYATLHDNGKAPKLDLQAYPTNI